MDLKYQAEAFGKWLKSSMDQKEIRFAADLAKMSQVSAQAISGMLSPRPSPNTNKYQVPRRETLIKLARALGVSKEDAFRAAGYLPSTEIEEDEEMAVLFSGYSTMTEEQRAEMKPILRMVAREVDAIIAREEAEPPQKTKAKG